MGSYLGRGGYYFGRAGSVVGLPWVSGVSLSLMMSLVTSCILQLSTSTSAPPQKFDVGKTCVMYRLQIVGLDVPVMGWCQVNGHQRAVNPVAVVLWTCKGHSFC